MPGDAKLDGAEVRRLLGISSATYYRWLRDGRLPGTKVGGRWRFARSAVEVLLGPSDEASDDAVRDLEAARQVCGQRLIRTGGVTADRSRSQRWLPSRS